MTDFENRLQSLYLPHLKGQLEQGDAVIFSGAGFSSDAHNIMGQQVPSVDMLKREYWKLCYGDFAYDDSSSLQNLYENALGTRKRQLTELTTHLLTVDAGSLPESYKAIFELPWLRSYTLNLDDLPEAASRHYSLARRVRAISAMTANAPGGVTPVGSVLQHIHLNGKLSDLPENVPFSTTQYGDRTARANPWYSQLVTDLISRCVVFVGTTLDEPPLWKHLAIRGAKGGRSNRELRHRSYLVTPTLPRARQDLLEGYNVIWLPFDVEQLVERVLSALTVTIPTGIASLQLKSSSSRQNGRPRHLSDFAIDINKKTNYLLGSEPTWSDLQCGRAIERESDSKLSAEIDKQLAAEGSKHPIVITAPPQNLWVKRGK